ncbi:MAG: hypothetical protein WA981_11700 [Glaciecola sp.]
MQITFTSGNGKWQGIWDFYPNRADFSMTKISPSYHYWVLFEGVPNGEINETDYWFSSSQSQAQEIHIPFSGDLSPVNGEDGPEWFAFGDTNVSRVIYVAQHQNDDHLDEYYMRPYMTVFGFGRNSGNKYLNQARTFSIGFVESSQYAEVNTAITQIVVSTQP